MWSLLPALYAKYFGIKLTAVASTVFVMRLFDGFADLGVGVLSDLHRDAGGTRKLWVVVGSILLLGACYLLFIPSLPVTSLYYLISSVLFFLCFAICEIPHLSWGSEITSDYSDRATVYGIRNIASRIGTGLFYSLPMWPIFTSREFTPEVLRFAEYVGVILVGVTVLWPVLFAPSGKCPRVKSTESLGSMFRAAAANKPLRLYIVAGACCTLCYGMWYGLIYIYLDTYLGKGEHASSIFLGSTILSTLSTPIWLKLIRKSSKAVTWNVGVGLFLVQLILTVMIRPSDSAWLVFGVILIANLCFTCHDVAAISIMGDVVDYGRMRQPRNQGGTYFAVVNLVSKAGLGLGGGISIAIAGLFGFDASKMTHSDWSIIGLKTGLIIVPFVLALCAIYLISLTPIDPRRHGIIQRRLQSRLKQAT